MYICDVDVLELKHSFHPLVIHRKASSKTVLGVVLFDFSLVLALCLIELLELIKVGDQEPAMFQLAIVAVALVLEAWKSGLCTHRVMFLTDSKAVKSTKGNSKNSFVDGLLRHVFQMEEDMHVKSDSKEFIINAKATGAQNVICFFSLIQSASKVHFLICVCCTSLHVTATTLMYTMDADVYCSGNLAHHALTYHLGNVTAF